MKSIPKRRISIAALLGSIVIAVAVPSAHAQDHQADFDRGFEQGYHSVLPGRLVSTSLIDPVPNDPQQTDYQLGITAGVARAERDEREQQDEDRGGRKSDDTKAGDSQP